MGKEFWEELLEKTNVRIMELEKIREETTSPSQKWWATNVLEDNYSWRKACCFFLGLGMRGDKC